MQHLFSVTSLRKFNTSLFRRRVFKNKNAKVITPVNNIKIPNYSARFFMHSRDTHANNDNNNNNGINFEATPKKRGKMENVNGKFIINASINDSQEFCAFTVNSGSTYTQLDINTASHFGLKSHPQLLLENSRDGSNSYGYLCKSTINIMNIKAPLVVVVGENKQSLLGLDAILKFSMVFDYPQSEFEISELIPKQPSVLSTSPSSSTSYHDPHHDSYSSSSTSPPPSYHPHPTAVFIDIDKMMEQLHLKEEDLVPVQFLPQPPLPENSLQQRNKNNHKLLNELRFIGY